MGAHVSVPMYRRSLSQRLRLEGRRCRACGIVQFPPQGACPRCRGTDWRPEVLSGSGRVVASTFITAQGAPPEFTEQARRTGGYVVALVALAEGPRVTAQIVDDDAPLSSGTPVTMVVRRLYDEEGVIRYGFKFRRADEPVP